MSVKIVERLQKYNVFMALTAMISLISFHLFFNARPLISIYPLLQQSGIVFFGTMAAYNFFQRNNKWSFLIPAVFSLGFAVVSGTDAVLVWLINLLTAALYQSPLFGFSLRNNTYTKPLLIAFCWTNFTVLLPGFALLNTYLSFVLVGIYALRFIETCSLAIATDLCHFELDIKQGLKTFPVTFGFNTGRLVCLVIALMPMYGLSYFAVSMDEHTMQLLAGVVPLSLYAVLLFSIKKFGNNKIARNLLDGWVAPEAIWLMLLLHFS